MKYIFLLFILFWSYANACEGDCVLCHPKLIKKDGKLDQEHQVLSTCKTCHTQEEMQKIDMGGGCGQDCWECHDIKKVTKSRVKEHQGLQRCIDCHLTLDKNLFNGAGSLESFSGASTLDDLMAQEVIVEEKNKTLIERVEELNQTAPQEKKELTFLEKVMLSFSNLWQKIIAIFG